MFLCARALYSVAVELRVSHAAVIARGLDVAHTEKYTCVCTSGIFRGVNVASPQSKCSPTARIRSSLWFSPDAAGVQQTNEGRPLA